MYDHDIHSEKFLSILEEYSDLDTNNINPDLEILPDFLNQDFNLSINTNSDNRFFSISDKNGVKSESSLNELDNKLISISKDNKYIYTNNLDVHWDDQSIFKGMSGNDIFYSNNFSNNNHSSPYDIYLASLGDDNYIGSDNNYQLIDYSFVADNYSGGFQLSNDLDLLSLDVSYSPLFIDQITSDNILVYKNSSIKSDNIDLLENIEFVNLGHFDDQLITGNKPFRSNIDFGKGDDQVIVNSEYIPTDFNHFLNLEKVIWNQTNLNGESLLDESANLISHEFDVNQIYEDEISTIAIGNYLDQLGSDSTPEYVFRTFDQNLTSNNLSSWLSINEIDANPYNINLKEVIVDYEFVDDIDNNVTWLEINAYDFRTNGSGLIGLEVDVDWDPSLLSLEPSLHNSKNVFGNNFPFFQNVGVLDTELNEITNQPERSFLQGIVAGSLPAAGRGQALGDMSDNSGSALTNWARIPFKYTSDHSSIDVNLNIILSPARQGQHVKPDEIIILPKNKPKVNVLEVRPSYLEIGSHLIVIDNNVDSFNHILNVKPVNDPPIALSEDDLPSNFFNSVIYQDSNYSLDLDQIFYDEDDNVLKYELISDTPWLSIDDNNLLFGTPLNKDVGFHNVSVKAIDSNNYDAISTFELEVININDAPEALLDIRTTNLSQGDSFTISLEDNTFYDKDFSVNSSEKFLYSIENSPDWILLDPLTGRLSGVPLNKDVGQSIINLRATDLAGEFAEIPVTFNVSNINDSPQRTANIPSFDNPIRINVDEYREINFSEWFSDIDLLVDQNEDLTFQLFVEDNSAEFITIDQFKFNNPESNWIDFDDTNELISFNPTSNLIGTQYIKVSAIDSSDSMASALIPIQVNYINNSPQINTISFSQFSSEISINGVNSFNFKQDLAESSSSNLSSGIEINLTEQSDFSIEIPFSVVNDVDLGIDPNEALTYQFSPLRNSNGEHVDTELLPIFLDSDNLRIHGNTSDLGLNESGGLSEWNTTLKVTDNSGDFVELDIILFLQRTNKSLSVELVEEQLIREEGSSFNLSEFINIEKPDIDGQIIFLSIEQKIEDNEIFNLLSSNFSPIVTQIADKKKWEISGSYEDILAFLTDSNLSNQGNSFYIGETIFTVNLRTELGLTGLSSETVSKDFSFISTPIPSVPVWDAESNFVANNDPLLFTPIGSLLKAQSSDPREYLTYNIKLPNDRVDLLLTDNNGDSIGQRQGDYYVLSESEWESVLLRSVDGNINEAEIEIYSTSYEPGTPLFQSSITRSLIIKASPFINGEPDIGTIAPFVAQRAGEPMEINVNIISPQYTRNTILEIELPLGTELDIKNRDDAQLFLISEENGFSKYRTNFKNNDTNYIDNFVFVMSSEEEFKGEFVTKITAYNTFLEDYDSFTSISKIDGDIKNNFTSASDQVEESWEVVQVAKQPEFPENDNLNLLNFENNSGLLHLPFRRGENNNGNRNPSEALTFSISNIPSGYALATLQDGIYKTVGATDKFGTITLFSLPSLSEDTEIASIDNFIPLLDGNLFLLPLSESVPSLSSFNQLFLSLGASISGQPGGDSRSLIATTTLQLDGSLEKLPLVGSFNTVVDPLIIDFNRDGKIELSSVSNSNNSFEFEMIPGSGPLYTSWLSENSNSNGNLDSAFVILNDDSNDSNNGDIVIESITEIFSEYFQSENGSRTFNSGISAFKSLDSNNDGNLNSSDTYWNEISLWFDNGDGIVSNDEIRNFSDYVSNVDFNNVETIANQPEWSNNNSILRKLTIEGVGEEDFYDIYDIGLNVLTSTGDTIQLDLKDSNDKNIIEIDENGDFGILNLESQNSDTWLENGLDSLTLVRLIGLPDQIKPSIGVKDSRNDWLFTWADYHQNGDKIELITDAFWSGDVNISAMLSQLQPDGSLNSSSIKSIAVNVKPIANKPYIVTSDISLKEDEMVVLSDLISDIYLLDRDGSEELSVEISSLPNGFQILKEENNLKRPILPIDDIYSFNLDELNKLFITPTKDISGSFDIDIAAVSTERANNNINKNIKTTNIIISGLADAPNDVILKPDIPDLFEGQSIPLNDIVDTDSDIVKLNDLDGSEFSRVEIILPEQIKLVNNNNNSWMPVSIISDDNLSTYLINEIDIVDLSITDQGFSTNKSFELVFTRISQEIDSGSSSRSLSRNISIPFIRNAIAAEYIIEEINVKEDMLTQSLENYINVIPNSDDDLISFRILNIPSNISLVNSEHIPYIISSENNYLEFQNLSNLYLKPDDNLSGSYQLDFKIISTPPLGGQIAETDIVSTILNIEGVPDTPQLLIDSNILDLNIKDNGWVDIYDLKMSIDSHDKDNSEEYSLILDFLDSKGNKIDNSDYLLNIKNNILADNSIEISSKSLNQLSIFIGETFNDIFLSLTPQSFEGSSKELGETFLMKINHNIEEVVIKAPLLEIQSNLDALEDQPVPLLSQNNGVINATHRGNGLGQSLYLQLSSLPVDSKIVKYLGEDQNGPIFSQAINKNEDGTLLDNIKLPYSQFLDLFWLASKDQTGLFSFDVHAISIGDETGEEKQSNTEKIVVTLQSVNDPPTIVDASDLPSINEGEVASFDLKDRFRDSDNDINNLIISVNLIDLDGNTNPLPNWISLSSDSVLTISPQNIDVGSYNLQIKAIDPLGLECKQVINLDIGNINTGPYMNNDVLVNWDQIIEDNKIIYGNQLFLRDEMQVSLLSLFRDEDLIHGDSLNFSISQDGQSWSNEINQLASVSQFKVLSILPIGKDKVGDNNFFLKATDDLGASIILNMRVNVLNTNEPPVVVRESAINVKNLVWEERINLIPENVFDLNLEGLFVDPDINSNLSEISPSNFPSWLIYEKSESNSGGRIYGTPQPHHVGVTTLSFSCFDQYGETVTYNLIIDVANINDAPVVVENPDLSTFGDLINNISTLNQGDYARLDPSILFYDDDIKYGDSLTYKINKVLDQSGEVIENDWLNLKFKSSDIPNVNDKFVLQPVIYLLNQDGSKGDVILANEIDKLEPNTSVIVQIEGHDMRDTESKGVITADFDLTWTNSLEIIDASTLLTSDLPLFPKITKSGNGIRFQAGAAPALGMGKSIGADGSEMIARFEAIIKNPSAKLDISLNAGTGDFRDGFSDGSGFRLDETNQYIHSVSNKEQSILEILAPSNRDVGLYTIYVEAKDQNGEVVEAILPLNIKNINDNPNIIKRTEEYFRSWFSEPKIEGDIYKSNISRLFDDDDLIYGDKLNVSILPDIDTNVQDIGKYLKLEYNSSGEIGVEIKLMPGSNQTITDRFKLRVNDLENQSIETDWFDIIIDPISNITDLNKGLSLTPLEDNELGNLSRKNLSLNLGSIFPFNYPEVYDKSGDELFLNISSNSDQFELRSTNFDVQDISDISVELDHKMLSINLTAFEEIRGDDLFDMSSLFLDLSPNILQKIPSNLDTSQSKYGIPLEVWTSTRVKDDYFNKFGISESQKNTIWIPILNSTPQFIPQNTSFINKNNLNQTSTLFKLSEVFIDEDPNDSLEWDIVLPKALEGIVEIDKVNGDISFSENINYIDNLPHGIHRIIVNSKDTNHLLGDSLTGSAKGTLKLNIVSNTELDSTINGINKIIASSKEELNEIFLKDKNLTELSSSEKEVVEIFRILDVDVNKRDNVIENLSNGSLSIIGATLNKNSIVMLDASINEDSVFLESSQKDVSNELIETTSRILDTDREILSPLGEILFSIDSNKETASFVDLILEDGGVDLDTIIKTNSSGIPFIFNSDIISLNEESDDKVNDYLNSIPFKLYNYDTNEEIFSVNSSSKSNINELFAENNINEIKNIDGSAYLIDTDGDLSIDRIRLLLIDQGFFDTDDRIGIIGDPLIPIQTNLLSEDTSLIDEPPPEISSSSSSPNNSSININFTSSSVFQSLGVAELIVEEISDFDLLPRSVNLDSGFSESFQIKSIVGDNDIGTNNLNSDSFASSLFSNMSGLFKSVGDSMFNNDIYQDLFQNENSSFSLEKALAFLFLPVVGERVITSVAKGIKKDLKLDIIRRDENISGRWKLPDRYGYSRFVELGTKKLELHVNDFSNNNSSDINLLPGFDNDGSSFLSLLIYNSSEPGRIVRSLSRSQKYFTRRESFDMDWGKWLETNFNSDTFLNDPILSRQKLSKLSNIVTMYHNENPIMSDIIMFAQISDCLQELEIE